jgi:hypothetical protein
MNGPAILVQIAVFKPESGTAAHNVTHLGSCLRLVIRVNEITDMAPDHFLRLVSQCLDTSLVDERNPAILLHQKDKVQQ